VLPLEVRNLLAQKRRARAKWQNFRYPSNRLIFNRLNRKLTKAIAYYKSLKHNDYTASLTNTDKSLWTATKKILQYKTTPSPLLLTDGHWAKSNEEKAEAFASHLSHIFTPHPDISDPAHSSVIIENLSSPLPMTLPPKAFNPSDITYIIKTLKKKENTWP
jgi:hypothetical protein